MFIQNGLCVMNKYMRYITIMIMLWLNHYTMMEPMAPRRTVRAHLEFNREKKMNLIYSPSLRSACIV